MFLNWLGHPSFQRYEQLMGVIYELGIVNLEQLQIITGWTIPVLHKCFRQIRSHAERHEERDLWIRRLTLPGSKTGGKYHGAYALGRLGVQYVLEMSMYDGGRVKVSPQSQIRHYLGVNSVLTNLLMAGMDRDRIVWRSSLKATEELLMFWEEGGKLNDEDKSKRRFIRPDARLWIDETAYWIEFDNDTEGARKIDQKFIRYKETLTPACLDQLPEEINTPVIWITISEERKNYLSDRWKTVSSTLEGPIPTMYFFIQGEETAFFLSNQGVAGIKYTKNVRKTSIKIPDKLPIASEYQKEHGSTTAQSDPLSRPEETKPSNSNIKLIPSNDKSPSTSSKKWEWGFD